MSGKRECTVGDPLYGGAFATDNCGELPFVLRGERSETSGPLPLVLQASPERVVPRCPHFTVCGGCQYQMASYKEQLGIKRDVLTSLLAPLKIDLSHIVMHAGEEYGYRNRIRLRIERVKGALRFGYNERGTTRFLAIEQCPIAAPILWECAQTMLLAAERSEDVAYWLDSASEVEFFTNETLQRVLVTMYVAPRTKAKQGSMERALHAIQSAAPSVVGLSALALDPKTGPTGRVVAEAGKGGLSYQVLEESYWIARGGFFQVNRFLLPELVKLVTSRNGKPLSGALAWDLFAGVGLFSRVLARSFERVVAVESNVQASQDNGAALRKIGAQHEAVAKTTVDFLQTAVVQRDRPDLIVLDPPRAGAGEQACALLNRAGAQTLMYVSCDPTTLARDLSVLQEQYDVRELHLIDLFPQTFHMETAVMLERRT